MSGYLIDTNCVSETTRPQPDSKVADWFRQTDDSLLHISVLTLGEIRKGITRLEIGRRRTQLEQWLDIQLQLRFEGRILPITGQIALRWGTQAGQALLRGRTLPVIDGLLAATALEHNLTIISRNTRDFEAANVPVFNPWT
ncbi:MAG: type II toxin-antitoxin system VapC family toxin [Bryobacteraceae bacterium]